MFSSKCAEVFCQSFENFSIVCTDCNLKTNVFNEFVRHYQEIHCTLQPLIKVETTNEVTQQTNFEPNSFPLEEACTADIINELSVKNEVFEDEYEINENSFSESDDNVPLQVILKQNPLESSQVSCPQCGKTLANKATLRMHIRRFHADSNAGDDTVKCPDCPDKIYSSSKALHRHRVVKHKQSKDEQMISEPELTTTNVLNTKAVEDDSFIKSESNAFEEDDLGQLAKNVCSGSDDDAALQNPTEDDESLDRTQHACSECNKKYNHRKSLRMHLRRCHPDVKMPRLNAAPTTTTCPDCPDKTYKSRKALQRHRREQHKFPPIDNFQCPHCEKQFKSRERVTAHMRLVHKIAKKPIELKRYPCPQCDRVFSQKHALKRHEIRHTGIRNVACSEPGCDLTFYDVKSMGAHRRNVHVATRRFVCDICGYGTKQFSTLQSHIRTHTGEKPFKCDICEKSFTTSGAVVEHKVIHNAQIRPHVCDICGKSFARPKALYHHKPLHFGIKKFVCKICGRAYAQQAGLSAHKRQHMAQGKLV